jgi:hypothetical protein
VQLKEMMRVDVDTVPTPRTNIDISALCGYESSKDLLNEAHAAIEFLRDSQTFEPTFWLATDQSASLPFFRDMIAKQNQKFKSAKSDVLSKNVWGSGVFDDYQSMLNHASLSNFKIQDVANLGVTDSFEECDTVACTDYASFVVRVNRDAVNNLYAQHTGAIARKSMKAVLGHELGHFIFDFYLTKGKNYRTFDEARRSIDDLKYHLTVDAVGMVLSGNNRAEFSEILRTSLRTKIFGDSRLVADSQSRVTCLDGLK